MLYAADDFWTLATRRVERAIGMMIEKYNEEHLVGFAVF